MQNANLGWIQTCGGSIEKLSFLVTAMAKIPKRTAALFHQRYTPFLVQNVQIFGGEENECDPGRADSSGRALNTELLVRPHTAHSVSSGRSGRSSLEIIKALISCQTLQRHPSITQTLKPPC